MEKKTVDAVTIEIVGNLLLSAAEEVGIAIVRSSYSNNIKERRDISTAVFDPEGNLIAQAEYIAMHMGSLLTSVKEVLKKYPLEDIHDGDMFIGNDPYKGGGTHLPDITVTCPVFGNGKLIGWIANLGHHSDIGGRVPGSQSGDAVSIFEEGLRIPLVKVCVDDVPQMSVIEFIMDNSRLSDERYGDLMAQIAGNRVGRKRIQEAFDRWQDTLVDAMYALEDYTERRMRAGIERLPDGVYTFEDYMDPSYMFHDQPGRIAVKVTVRGNSMNFDFTGTAEQVEAPINLTYNGLMATVFYCMKALIDPEIPTNIGIARTFTITAEEGLLVNCKSPSAVAARIDSAMRVVDVIFGAMDPIVGNRAMACCSSTCTTPTFSGYAPTDIHKEHYLLYLEVIAGGSGAYPDMDGFSGVQVHMTNTSNLPIEALEMEFPLLNILEYRYRTNSGGAGKFRGGCGIERRYEAVADEVTVTLLGDRHVIPPWGLEGGHAGQGGANILFHADGRTERFGSRLTNYTMKKGDILSVSSPGSGGYGNPLLREPEAVLTDVIEGKIDLDESRKYGVAIERNEKGFYIDREATRKLREKAQI